MGYKEWNHAPSYFCLFCRIQINLSNQEKKKFIVLRTATYIKLLINETIIVMLINQIPTCYISTAFYFASGSFPDHGLLGLEGHEPPGWTLLQPLGTEFGGDKPLGRTDIKRLRDWTHFCSLRGRAVQTAKLHEITRTNMASWTGVTFFTISMIWYELSVSVYLYTSYNK